MKWFLLVAIYLYKRLPVRFKRQCLFEETCSTIVARVARESGLRPALRALRTRISLCQPGYLVYYDNDTKEWRVRFANGSTSKTNSGQLADLVLSPYRHLSVHTRPPSVGIANSCHESVSTPTPGRCGG
jgi:putative component of membrane protein insertase Oxa1/YidC/SpoIIIJ protein YidD